MPAHGREERGGAGTRSGRRLPGGGSAVALLAAVLLIGSALPIARLAASADLEDLLWDLQVVPLEGEAPGFTLPDLAGGSWSLAGARGRGVFLYFWASW